MATEQPWPDQYPVDTVKTTMGMTLTSVDRAEYTDLRRQGLIDFDEQPAEQPATPTPATPRVIRNESE